MASPSRKALIVDDEPHIRSFMCAVLRRGGFQTAEARDGQEALETVEAAAGGFDIVVTDIRMPRMDGVELSQRLSELYPELPILFVSAFALEEPQRSVPRSRFLPKPFAADVLVKRVQSLAAQHAGV